MLSPKTSVSISLNTQNILRSNQTDIDAQPDFSAKVARAKALWSTKISTHSKETAFKNVITTLKKAYYGEEGICQYCENNEGTDIEHIYPKGHFPERAFVFENYLWACSNCNTHYKKDTFSVFNPPGSDIEIVLTPRRGRNPLVPSVPPSDDGLIIHTRNDSPLDFLWLNFATFRFIVPRSKWGNSRDKKRIDWTRKYLGLNRAYLVEVRSKIFDRYCDLLQRYVHIRNLLEAQLILSIPALYAHIYAGMSPTQIRVALLSKIQAHIQNEKHPTVWAEIKRQSQLAHKHPSLEAFAELFTVAPETLTF
jgi:hypothetical protein